MSSRFLSRCYKPILSLPRIPNPKCRGFCSESDPDSGSELPVDSPPEEGPVAAKPVISEAAAKKKGFGSQLKLENFHPTLNARTVTRYVKNFLPEVISSTVGAAGDEFGALPGVITGGFVNLSKQGLKMGFNKAVETVRGGGVGDKKSGQSRFFEVPDFEVERFVSLFTNVDIVLIPVKKGLITKDGKGGVNVSSKKDGNGRKKDGNGGMNVSSKKDGNGRKKDGNGKGLKGGKNGDSVKEGNGERNGLKEKEKEGDENGLNVKTEKE